MSGQGRFFAIDRRCWSQVCNLGINEAVAYLVMACGTGRSNYETRWSAEAMHKHAGMAWYRGKAAIESLIRATLVSFGKEHTKGKPRYELLPYKSASKEHNVQDGELIWLPNSIVVGTPNGEPSPVARLRSASDVWSLRLFVDLYHSQNLRDDGGISHRLLRMSYVRKQIGESGIYIIWAFRFDERHLWWRGPFEVHQGRSKEGPHPVWQCLKLLEQMGLLTFVPHLIESDSDEAEVIHPLGVGGKQEEPIETEVGAAARDAAERMCFEWAIERAVEEGYENYCPVLRTLPNVQLVGIVRLLYRPHTRLTAAWYAHLHESGEVAVARYREMAGASSASGNLERVTHEDILF